MYVLCICCVFILYLCGQICIYLTKKLDLYFCDWKFSKKKKKKVEKNECVLKVPRDAKLTLPMFCNTERCVLRLAVNPSSQRKVRLLDFTLENVRQNSLL